MNHDRVARARDQLPDGTSPAGQPAPPPQPARPPVRRHNATLEELRRQMNDDDVVDLFVADFLAALADRIRDVAGLLRENRTEACVTALFTLETSGAMVGADDLTRAAAALRRAVSGGDGPRIGQLYASLVAVGRCEAETLDR